METNPGRRADGGETWQCALWQSQEGGRQVAPEDTNRAGATRCAAGGHLYKLQNRAVVWNEARSTPHSHEPSRFSGLYQAEIRGVRESISRDNACWDLGEIAVH